MDSHSYNHTIALFSNELRLFLILLLIQKQHLLRVHFVSPLETEKSNVNRNTKKFTNYGHALHFDAHKVGKYFKKIVLKNTKIKHIDSEVLDITLNETGFLSSLKLKNQEIINGDFFIDASGFSRVLMKKLETPWVSYNKNLPVNSAMPFILNYKEREMPDPYTTAWAQSSGWMWQIPVLERKGCGYVFDDNFITPEQAQAEIETTLGRSIDPIRVLKFDTGRLENTWVKNCLAIGLSAAFAEPLEATSIHSTIVQLTKFVFEYLIHILLHYLYSHRHSHRHSLVFRTCGRDFLSLH
jgi:tryptophan halogenase